MQKILEKLKFDIVGWFSIARWKSPSIREEPKTPGDEAEPQSIKFLTKSINIDFIETCLKQNTFLTQFHFKESCDFFRDYPRNIVGVKITLYTSLYYHRPYERGTLGLHLYLSPYLSLKFFTLYSPTQIMKSYTLILFFSVFFFVLSIPVLTWVLQLFSNHRIGVPSVKISRSQN